MAAEDPIKRALAPSFERLGARLLAASKGRRVVFLQNFGNYGDALIRAGTLCFFADLGVRVHEIDLRDRPRKLASLLVAGAGRLGGRPLFVYAGSGAWSEFAPGARKHAGRLTRIGADVFVLPSTFESVAGVHVERLTAFRRDEHNSRAVFPNSDFCHDMALYLAICGVERVLPERNAQPRGLGVFFRRDNEARGHGFDRHPDNRDLSAESDHRGEIAPFLRAIDAVETLVTDRLHIGVAGALLGKAVGLATGASFKIRAVFRSSLDGVFPNVRLLPDDAAIEAFLHEHRI